MELLQSLNLIESLRLVIVMTKIRIMSLFGENGNMYLDTTSTWASPGYMHGTVERVRYSLL